jgi:Zn-dependent peptidase ImmA (M78 family)
MLVQSARAMQWTNRSVIRFAAGEDDPVALIERKARELALRARDAGWEGPPFNPLAIAKLLNIPAEANADVIDARTISNEKGLRIQFNPTQPRERVRFSIAHEVAHALFPDASDAPRHRGGDRSDPDDWQLEMLCNLAAAEFVMPMGSLPPRDGLPRIEELIKECRRFDVSVEAFLIRVTKVTNEPVIMFCASPTTGPTSLATYRIDYTVPSSTVPNLYLVGRVIPGEVSYMGARLSATPTMPSKIGSGMKVLRSNALAFPAIPAQSILALLVSFVSRAVQPDGKV